MAKVNIANYIIEEMASEKASRLDMEERISLVDNLIDKWSRKEYFQPDLSDKEPQ